MPSVVDRTRLITNGFSPATGPDAWPRSSCRHLVLHSLEGYEDGAIAHWNTGAAGAHLIGTREGELVLCVPLDLVTWHAGTSPQTGRVMRGVDFRHYNINPDSCGYELEGFAFDGQGFTSEQYATLIRFARWYRAELGWAGTADVTWRHSEISNQRGDPGPLFDMALFRAGLET